jgi:hypothetical protein
MYIFLGGPTRTFLMDLWSQIGTICIPINDSNKTIFESCGSYVVPERNVAVQKNAQHLYRAIGRIMSYCILHEQQIANHMMVRTFTLKGIQPTALNIPVPSH